ncbi:helix-turn-helix domain-containing protein [Rhodococcus sp. NPDC058521]|uniref:helix-turn-helix domain-containing protein n=1 Tax=Rhodococcus sp. NPDC058521 TaxID=3346536 RepID=UPI0036492F1B
MDAQRRLTLVVGGGNATSPSAEPAPLVREVYGRVLREERLDQDRSLDDVARTVGMSKQYLSEVERGRKEPSSEMLRSVCGALGLPVDQLLHRSIRRMNHRQGRPVVNGPNLLAA